jgi:hypothetical protein
MSNHLINERGLNMDFIGPYMFLKFGKKEHLKDLQLTGHLYCNTFKYFTEIEDGKARGDKDETVVRQLLGKVKVDLHGANYPNDILTVKDIPARLQLRDNIGNMFCLYSIDTRHYKNTFKYQFNELVGKFDDCSLVIVNVPEFFNRIKLALTRQKLLYSIDFVKYCDLKKYHGDKGPFVKDIAYEYQKEYRIVIYNQTNSSTSIYIGNIEDISIFNDGGVSDLDVRFHYSE